MNGNTENAFKRSKEHDILFDIDMYHFTTSQQRSGTLADHDMQGLHTSRP
jgi:hypothetical protein